jgi:hypothetical protein
MAKGLTFKIGCWWPIEKEKLIVKYKIIDDHRVITFYKKCTDRKFKSLTGIKFPWFGKYKGKMLVPEGLWGKIAPIYLQSGGNLLPKGVKVTAQVLTNE